MEQRLALNELVEMKTSIERGAQGESGGDQSPPTTDAAGRAAVPTLDFSDGKEGVPARREGSIPAEAGKCISNYSPAMGVQSWVPSPCVAQVAFYVARRGHVRSATAAAAATAVAAASRGESRCGSNR